MSVSFCARLCWSGEIRFLSDLLNHWVCLIFLAIWSSAISRFKQNKANRELHIPTNLNLVLGSLFRCHHPRLLKGPTSVFFNLPCSSSGFKTLILIYEVLRLSDRQTGWVEEGDGESLISSWNMFYAWRNIRATADGGASREKPE